MNISEFTARVILLFLPGIVCEVFVDKLTVHEERKPFRFVIHAFLFGASSYGLFWLLWWFNFWFVSYTKIIIVRIPHWPSEIAIHHAMLDPKQSLNFVEVLVATIVSIPIAFLFSFAINNKWLVHIAQKWGVSNKFAESDVWGFLFNSDRSGWVVVRDIANDLVYEGYLAAFSDGSSPRELLLEDAMVYRNVSGEPLYSVDALYLSTGSQDWKIEFPAIAMTARQTENADAYLGLPKSLPQEPANESA